MAEILVGQSILTLFVVLDPIGAIPFYEGLTNDLGYTEKKRVARLTAAITASLLLIFAFSRSFILS